MNEHQISVQEVKKKLDSMQIILIDVREPYENMIAKIEGSILIPLKELPGKLIEIKNIAKDKDKDIVVYCHHGFRSSFAAELLRRNGIKVRSMSGGIDEWSRKVDSSVKVY